MDPLEMTVDGEPVRGSITFESNPIEIPPSMYPEPDPDWRYTDHQGHEHYYDDGYPTLERIVVNTWWCVDCHEHHDDVALACRICGEQIEPGTQPPSPYPTFVQGTTTWTVEVDRHFERGSQVTVEVAGRVGTAEVVECEMRSGERGWSMLAGVGELSEAAAR